MAIDSWNGSLLCAITWFTIWLYDPFHINNLFQSLDLHFNHLIFISIAWFSFWITWFQSFHFNHLMIISITWSSFQSFIFISIIWSSFQSLVNYFNHLLIISITWSSSQSHDLHFNHLLFSISNDSWLFFVYFLVCSYVRFIRGPALHGCHIPPGIAGEYMIFFLTAVYPH